MSDFHEQ
jgi:hypothetical protein